MPLRLVKAHAAAVPVAMDTLGPAPLTYALFRPPTGQALIAGAMPMRAASLVN